MSDPAPSPVANHLPHWKKPSISLISIRRSSRSAPPGLGVAVPPAAGWAGQ